MVGFIRSKSLCGELVTIFYQRLKGYGSDELLRMICVPSANKSLKQ